MKKIFFVSCLFVMTIQSWRNTIPIVQIRMLMRRMAEMDLRRQNLFVGGSLESWLQWLRF